MRRSLKFVLLLLTVFAAMGALVAALVAWEAWQARLPGNLLLEVDFGQPLREQVPESAVAGLLFERRMRLRDLVEALQAAAADPRVSGLVARVSPAAMGLAQIEEVRDAVAAFRARGKPAIAWTDSFGEVTPDNASYYLATAFDEIYIQPSGDVGLTGVDLTATFLRGTFDKLGIEPEMGQRYEYKNAVNTYTERSLTAAHRQALDALAGSIYGRIVEAVAAARKLPVGQVGALVDQGPLLGEEALRSHLVDGLLYRDQVYAHARRLAGKRGRPQLLFLRRYWERADKPWSDGGRTIALVYGVGDVIRGRSDYDPVFGSTSLGSDTVAAALRNASDDKSVAAILLRIDSPGGSYVASDSIWREVMRARQKGKPVIASMGDVAASGGYFIALAADKIVAHPCTLTGSIGVFGGKMVTRGLTDKLGVTFDSVQRGAHADMWSPAQPFTPEEWAKLNGWLDHVYADFTRKAAAGRHLSLARLQELARGRVWSGSDAQRRGLVDALGGYSTALALARQAAHIAADAPIELREYPRPRSAWRTLIAGREDSSEDQDAQILGRTLQALQPALRALRAAGVLGDSPPEPLRAPELSLR